MIEIRADAPAAPDWGEPCTGCGLCCLAEPCPLGMLISRRRHGACAALQWSDNEGRYLCGALAWTSPPPGARATLLRRGLKRLVQRWIGAGVGCDAELQRVEASEPAERSATKKRPS